MSDPMVLNDLAGMAILEGRHEDAAKLLSAAAELAESVSAKRVLNERAQDEARIAWVQRVCRDFLGWEIGSHVDG